MKRKSFVLAIVTLIALVVVVPFTLAAAGSGGTAVKPPVKSKPFLAKGTVVAVDATAGTLLVTVAKGSHNVKPLVGTDVTFTLAAASHIFARTIGPNGRVHLNPATLADVTVGSKVNINGRVDRTDPSAPVYVARHIVARLAPAPIPSPEPSPTDTTSPSPAPAL